MGFTGKEPERYIFNRKAAALRTPWVKDLARRLRRPRVLGVGLVGCRVAGGGGGVRAQGLELRFGL